MKFQDSSLNGLKVSVTHTRSKSNMPHQLFQSWGLKETNNLCYGNPQIIKILPFLLYELRHEKTCCLYLRKQTGIR